MPPRLNCRTELSTRTSCYTNRPLVINVPVKHTSCAAPTFSSPRQHDNGLTFRPLNGVAGHPCHGLPSCQFFSFLRPSIIDLGSDTGQTDRQRPSLHYVPTLLGRRHKKKLEHHSHARQYHCANISNACTLSVSRSTPAAHTRC